MKTARFSPAIKAPERYGIVAQTFHWLTAILVTTAFIYGPGGSALQVYSAAQDADRRLHESLGLAVFVLALLRLSWRAFDQRPRAPAGPIWQSRLAAAVQVALYALMFALPITAVMGAWLAGHPVTLLGRVEFASPFPAAHDLGSALAQVHGWLGDAILWLAGLHAAAAVFHHWMLKDGVLVSMLPRWFPVQRRRG